MPASTTEYDLGLLASAQIQSGHLLDGRDHPSTPRTDNLEAARAYSNTGPTMATLPVNGTHVKTPLRPFYRTKRGIIIIIMVVVAIVIAIAGGVVGGLKSKTSRTSLSQPNGVGTAPNGVDTTTTTLGLATSTLGLATPTLGPATTSTFGPATATLPTLGPATTTLASATAVVTTFFGPATTI